MGHFQKRNSEKMKLSAILASLAVAQSDDSSSGLDLTTLMLMSGGNMGGNMAQNPMLMYSLLADDSDSSDKLLPLMMMQGQGEFNPMMYLLLNKDDDSSVKDLLPLMMMSGQATDMNSLLPLMLLDDSSDGSSSTLKDLLPLMMMSGQTSSSMGE